MFEFFWLVNFWNQSYIRCVASARETRRCIELIDNCIHVTLEHFPCTFDKLEIEALGTRGFVCVTWWYHNINIFIREWLYQGGSLFLWKTLELKTLKNRSVRAFFFEFFLKNSLASAMIFKGSSTVLPSTSIDEIEFYLLLFSAMAWKYYVFRSPSLSHEILEFWAQYNSFLFIHNQRSDWTDFFFSNSSGFRFLWLDLSSRSWIIDYSVAMLESILPKLSWFHCFSFCLITCSFSTMEMEELGQDSLTIFKHFEFGNQWFWNLKGFRPQFFILEFTSNGLWSESPCRRRVTFSEGKIESHSRFTKTLSRILFDFPLSHVNPLVEDPIFIRYKSCTKFQNQFHIKKLWSFLFSRALIHR